jgi:adenine-specific DNA-methyltransferase
MELQLTASSFPAVVIEGDCIQIMPRMPSGSVDFILTDPPYLCNYLDRSGRRIKNDDREDWLVPAFKEMFRVLKDDSFCVCFYGWHRADAFIHAWRSAGFRILEHLVFIKPYESSRRYVSRRHEQAYVLAKGFPRIPQYPPADVMNWQYTGNKLHPTQKPLAILRPLIESFSRAGDFVLDPFCGSGSTLVAASELGRRSIGLELEPEFAEVAKTRVGSVDIAALEIAILRIVFIVLIPILQLTQC